MGFVAGVPARANAQEPSPAALVAARELFRDATADVDASRYDVALEKFRRVAAVKETAAVRFNIARCEEQLGRVGSALADFETASREGSADAKSADIAKLARDKANEIRPRVPRLTIAAPASAPGDLTVKLDGEKQPTATLGVPLPLDPGKHTVEATGGGERFAKSLELRESTSETVKIDLPAPKTASTSAPRAVTSDAPPTPPAEQPAKHEPESSANYWPAGIALGVAGAAGIASLTFVLLHDQNVSDLSTEMSLDCTPKGCPQSSSAKLDPLQQSAKRNEGLAIGFGVGAGVAAAVGIYFLVAPPRTKEADKTPTARLVPGPGSLSVVGEF